LCIYNNEVFSITIRKPFGLETFVQELKKAYYRFKTLSVKKFDEFGRIN